MLFYSDVDHAKYHPAQLWALCRRLSDLISHTALWNKKSRWEGQRSASSTPMVIEQSLLFEHWQVKSWWWWLVSMLKQNVRGSGPSMWVFASCVGSGEDRSVAGRMLWRDCGSRLYARGWVVLNYHCSTGAAAFEPAGRECVQAERWRINGRKQVRDGKMSVVSQPARANS